MTAAMTEPTAPPTAVVTVKRAEGRYDVEIWRHATSTLVRCPGLGVTVTMTADLRMDIGASLVRAADLLGNNRCGRDHITSLGSWDLPVLETGVQRVELDAVRDDAENVYGALISIDGMALDGYLDERAARLFGETLLAANERQPPASLPESSTTAAPATMSASPTIFTAPSGSLNSTRPSTAIVTTPTPDQTP